MKIVIVTGANRGLGLEIVKGLKGCHVILAVRDVEKGRQAISKLVGSFDVLPLDVSSLDSIQSFVEVIKRKYPSVDVLVNNAGIYHNEFSVIDFLGSRLDSVWVTNTLGPYVLSKKLMGSVKKIVFMNSVAGHGVKLDLDSLKGNNPKQSYSQSKYGTILLTRYFMDKVMVIGTHPGYSHTDIFEGRKAGSLKDVIRFATRVLAQDPRLGSQGALAAVQWDYQHGDYLVPKGFMQLYGKPKAVRIEDYYSEADYKVFKEYLEQLY